MTQALRAAWRALARRPAFTGVAVLTLALGIGANAAIFSVIDAVLLRPLPYPDPARLVIVWEHSPEVEARLGFDRLPVSAADFVNFQEGQGSFTGLASMRADRVTLTEGEAERIGALRVTAEFFDLLGLPPLLGRTFRPEDAAHGRAVVLAHGLWVRRFAADPRIVGRAISLNGEPALVTGVMPRGFHFPATGDLPAAFGFITSPEIWSLDQISPAQRASRAGRNRVLLGRLADGVSIQAAEADLGAIAAAVARDSPAAGMTSTVRLVPLREQLVARVRQALLVLLAAVAVVLLIACANVANLLLVRATVRQRELTVRLALGATRRRLVGELLVESVLRAVVAGSAGLLLAWWTLQALVAAAPQDLPAMAQATLDGRVLFYTLGVAVITGVLFGLLPALQATGTRVAEGLREGARGTVGSRRGHRLRGALVVAEVALAVVLLVAAALLVQAFARLTRVEAGYDARPVLTFEVTLPGGYAGPRAAGFYEELVARLGALPGIDRVGLTSSLPMTGGDQLAQLTIEGAPPPEPGQELLAEYRTATTGYFETLRIPLLEGAWLPDVSGAPAPRFALVSERLARAAWPGASPVGQRLKLARPDVDAPWHTVVGVVGDTRHAGLDVALRAQVYTPLLRSPGAQAGIVARTAGDPLSMAPSARGVVAALDAAVPVARVQSLEDLLATSVAGRRFQVFVIGTFAVLALVLAMVGLYAVMAYSVAERLHEMCVRLALGARPATLLGMVLAEGVRLVGLGLALGLLAAAGLTRLIEAQLFGVHVRDLRTFLAVPTALAVVGLLGCLVPALRAMRADPAAALRGE